MDSRLGGRYQIVREIGQGGMGRVFQAVDTQTGRAVAAKVLIASGDIDLHALLRFQQEGTVLSTLKHPNIVEVYGTFMEEHTSCIIMELLEGRSLAQILQSEGRLPLSRVKGLGRQVLAALAYAHGRGIVHRDVKPDNIMVIGNDYVKVTDFGIARIVQEGSTLATRTGTAIGTPLYMSPEQIEGQKIDGRADLYSFGAVLYELVTGRPPFEGSDPVTIAFKHVHREPLPPTQLQADVPRDWEALILRALAKDPAERFQSADGMLAEFAALTTPGVAPGTLPQTQIVRPEDVPPPTPWPQPPPNRPSPGYTVPAPTNYQPPPPATASPTPSPQPGFWQNQQAPAWQQQPAPPSGSPPPPWQAPGQPPWGQQPGQPPPRKPGPPVPWPLIAGGAAALAVIIALVGFFALRSGSASPAPTATATINPTATIGPTATTGLAKSLSYTNPANGDSIVVSATYDTVGSSLHRPSAGHEFFILHATIHNGSSASHYYSGLDFHVADQNGTTYSRTFSFPARYGTAIAYTMAGGETRTGVAVFEIPTTTTVMTVRWDDSSSISPPRLLGRFHLNG